MQHKRCVQIISLAAAAAAADDDDGDDMCFVLLVYIATIAQRVC